MRSIDVLAASSLKGSLDEAVLPFEKDHGLMSSVSYAGSQELAQSINHGAPCDVFISADKDQMDVAAKSGRLAATPDLFLRNSLVMVFSKKVKNPSLGRMAEPGFKLVLPAEQVPAGKYARKILSKDVVIAARILMNVVSEETNVRSVLTKVELGEADGGIVYKTDAMSSNGKVTTVDFPYQTDVYAQYWIAPLKGKNEKNAIAMVAFLTSKSATDVFRKYGFQE